MEIEGEESNFEEESICSKSWSQSTQPNLFFDQQTEVSQSLYLNQQNHPSNNKLPFFNQNPPFNLHPQFEFFKDRKTAFDCLNHPSDGTQQKCREPLNDQNSSSDEEYLGFDQSTYASKDNQSEEDSLEGLVEEEEDSYSIDLNDYLRYKNINNLS